MPAKRQRIEFGRSVTNSEQDSKSAIELPSTLDRASSFSGASKSQTTSFISGGSLLALHEQSVNRTVVSKSVREAQVGTKSKVSRSGEQKSQGTLLGFLGKAKPCSVKRPILGNKLSEPSQGARYAPSQPFSSKNIQQAMHLPSRTEVPCLPPVLASHRLGARQATRPKAGLGVEQSDKNEYVFLSSSPPRPKAAVVEPEIVRDEPSGLSANPALLPLLRPAASMHTTTMAAIQGGGYKKTLGVKRSMTGWPSQKGNGFVPPTIKRPG